MLRYFLLRYVMFVIVDTYIVAYCPSSNNNKSPRFCFSGNRRYGTYERNLDRDGGVCGRLDHQVRRLFTTNKQKTKRTKKQAAYRSSGNSIIDSVIISDSVGK